MRGLVTLAEAGNERPVLEFVAHLFWAGAGKQSISWSRRADPGGRWVWV